MLIVYLPIELGFALIYNILLLINIFTYFFYYKDSHLVLSIFESPFAWNFIFYVFFEGLRVSL